MGLCSLRSLIGAGIAERICLSVALAFMSFSQVFSDDRVFYVSSDGADAWSGVVDVPSQDGTDGPFATLARARDAVRELKKNDPTTGKIIVEVSDGVYTLDEPLKLTAEDGGLSPELPVVWRVKEGDSVLLNAGIYLKNARQTMDPEILKRFKPGVGEKLCEFELSDRDVGDLGTAANGPELFFKTEPTRIARYPNSGFVKITGLVEDGTKEFVSHGRKGIVEGKFKFDDPEIAKCFDEKDLWTSGYWFWDWAEQKHRVDSLDPESMTISVEPPYHTYGYRTGQWFYIFNAVRELDEPGEYYIDRDSRRLYFYPPEGKFQDGDFLLTHLPHVFELDHVSNLVISGFKMCGSRSDAITGSQLRSAIVEQCDIYDVSGSGISLNGVELTVSQCELWRLGRSGIRISGGDRTTLEPSGNKVVDNYIHDYALVERVYQPGINLQGVGNYAAHNLIENAPHMGMGFGGNDNILEFNEICNVCFESNDAGAIYTGRNWTMRGNILRYNYLRDIRGFENRGCVGIYLDDMFSSAEILDNLFVNVTRAAFIGGGHDCKINGNLFVNCNPALHIDARGAGWAKERVDSWIQEGKEKGTINGIKYQEEPYLSRYPSLANILKDEEAAHFPTGCEVVGNICVGGSWNVAKKSQWEGSSIEDSALPYLKIKDNFIAEEESYSFFVDPEHGDYRLKSDSSPALEGYKSLPVLKMGLESDRMKAKAKAWRFR